MVAASINFPFWRGRVRHPIKHRLAALARRTGLFDAAYGPNRSTSASCSGPTAPARRRTSAWAGATTPTPRRWAAGSWRATASTSCSSTCPRPTRPRTGRRRRATSTPSRAPTSVATLMSAAAAWSRSSSATGVLLADHGQSAVEDRGRRPRRVRRPAPVRGAARTDPGDPIWRCRLEPGGACVPARRRRRPPRARRAPACALAVDLAAWREDGARRRAPRGPRAAVRAGRPAARPPRRRLDGRGRPRALELVTDGTRSPRRLSERARTPLAASSAA